MGKWVMLDPPYNAIILNERRRPLNVMEVRGMLADRKKLSFADGLNYNGAPVEEGEITEYYAKDMFWFSLRDVQGYCSEERNGVYCLSVVPAGYDMRKSRLVNIDYRIERWGESKWLTEWKKELASDTPIYVSPSWLYQ